VVAMRLGTIHGCSSMHRARRGAVMQAASRRQCKFCDARVMRDRGRAR
jgi:hypothetical protein